MSAVDESHQPRHFRWQREERVGVVTLDRPERKNPLTFDSYTELRDLFRALTHTSPSGRWSSLARAVTSAPAGMCTRSSGP